MPESGQAPLLHVPGVYVHLCDDSTAALGNMELCLKKEM